MAQKYKAVLTKIGAAKIAAATAGGTKINLTQMAVGDGGGTLPTPDPTQTKLIAEKHRAALNKVIVDPKHKNYLVAEMVIPPEIGGFWMRELGLYDEVGALIAVSNMAESYKPLLSEGSGRAQTLRMVVIVSDMDTVNLLIDSSTVLATQEYVDDKLLEHEQSRRHPDATLKEKGFTQLSSATNSNSEELAATPKAVKVVYDLANGKYTAQDASTAQKGIVQLSSATDSTSETLAATPKAVKAAYDKAAEADKNAKTADDNAKKANENANTRLEKDKNLSDLNDKPLARKNLGLGSAATYDVQASPADATPGKLVPIGGFGLGAENTPVANINADAMRVSGFYGGPGVSGVNYYDPYAALLVMSRYNTDGGMMQISANGKAAVRGRGFDKLSDWNELFGKLNPPTAQDCNALPSDGTALAANKLATARTIAGVSFDGTRNIDIPAGSVGAYTKAEVNSLIPTSSVSGTSVKVFIWMGIMIQVGRVNGSVSSSTELTLPVAFKSYAQVLGSVDAASGNGVNAGVNMIGLGKIAFTRAGQYGPLTFLAIGDV
ncbi:phage tail protein [Hafnia paralvei]|uniref:phage tail protein n=1 Tax=Hafnia paralvei TaxID=546367 RepID=UPI00300C3A9E